MSGIGRRDLLKGSAILLGVASVSSLAGCGSDSNEGVVQMEGAEAFPSTTLTDMVTYGDVAVRIRINSEYEIGLTPEETSRGEGTTTRILRASTVGSSFWNRPTYNARPIGRPDEEFEISDGGYVVSGGNRRRLVVSGRPSLVVGSEYVAFRCKTDLGTGEGASWICLMLLPLKGATLELEGVQGLDSSVARQSGSDLRTLGLALTQMSPDPKALPFMDLDPVERYRRAVA